MNKIIVGYTILITITLITALIGVLKRKAILGFGEMNLVNMSSIKFWAKILINPYIIGIFMISVLMFVGTLIVFSLITADKVMVMSWSLIVPAFIITIFLNGLLLNEKFNPSKWKYLGLLGISVIISIIGVKGYLK